MPTGAPLPPFPLFPQEEIEPSLANAANAHAVEEMDVKPVPAGALLPPKPLLPQAEIEPSSANAAKALNVEKMDVKPAADGASNCPPPLVLSPPSAAQLRPSAGKEARGVP